MRNIDSIKDSRNKWLIGAGAALLVCLAFFITQWLRKPPTPQQVAQSALDCTLASDYGCLWEYVPETERDIYGINREQFIRIMDEYVEGTMGKVKLVRKDVSAIGTGQASAEAEVILPSGKTSRVTIRTAKTPNGVDTINLLATLIILVQTFEAPDTPGVHRMQHWLTRARQDGPRLTQLGMKGVYRGPERGFETWQEWQSRLETGLAKQAKASAGQ